MTEAGKLAVYSLARTDSMQIAATTDGAQPVDISFLKC